MTHDDEKKIDHDENGSDAQMQRRFIEGKLQGRARASRRRVGRSGKRDFFSQ